MQNQWVLMEHYRLHTVEEWPEGPRKRATIAAILATLESLAHQGAQCAPKCSVCEGRKKSATVLEFPTLSHTSETTHLAA